MITPRLRPRLDMDVPLEPAELAARLDALIRRPGSSCRGLVTERQVDLRIHEAQRHFWSPQLTVIMKREDDATRLRGHFGPNNEVWTLFLACYGFVILSAVTGFFYGVSQLIVEEYAWALWTIPAAAVLVVLIYVAAGIGQRLGHDQVDTLQRFLEDAVRGGSADDADEGPSEPTGAEPR